MTSSVEYRPIEGFPGYEIGSDGSVWSSSILRSWNRGKRVLLSTRCDRDGYLRVRLVREGVRKRFNKMIHVLMIEAFVGPRPDGYVCRHLNGINTDNRLENLAWGTPQDNSDDRARHGRTVRGSRFWSARLSENDVRQIRELRGSHRISLRALAVAFGVRVSTIHCVVNGNSWRSVPVGVQP